MKHLVIREIAEPLFRRLGTALGAYLVGLGVHATAADQIVLGALALGGVGVDLLLSHIARKVR